MDSDLAKVTSASAHLIAGSVIMSGVAIFGAILLTTSTSPFVLIALIPGLFWGAQMCSRGIRSMPFLY